MAVFFRVEAIFFSVETMFVCTPMVKNTAQFTLSTIVIESGEDHWEVVLIMTIVLVLFCVLI